MPGSIIVAATALVVVITLDGCTVPLGRDTQSVPAAHAPLDDDTALDARLARCAARGTSATTDTDCQSAWAEARHRILPLPLEK